MGVGTCFFSFFVDVCFFDVFSLKKWWKQLVSEGTFSLGLIQEPQTGNFDAAIFFQMVFLRLQSIHLIDLFGMIAAEWSSFQVQRFATKTRCDFLKDGWAVFTKISGWLDRLSQWECLFRGR